MERGSKDNYIVKPPRLLLILGGFSYARKGAFILSVTGQIKNYMQFRKKLDDRQKAARKAMDNLTSDIKKCAPGWVATEVTKQYSVKKGDITGQKIGNVRTEGSDFTEVRIVYTGRVLTPIDFSKNTP